MKIFETSGADYINLDQVTRFERGKDSITLHFDAENQMTLHNDDAEKLALLLSKLASAS